MFTPAPWTVMKDYPIFIKANGHLIAETTLKSFGREDCPTPEEARANAQLIATAPDLLEALQLLQNAFIHRDGNTKGNQAKTDIITLNPEVGDALNSARQAIQKAIGGA